MGARAMTAVLVAVAIILAVVLAVAGASIRVLREYERAVVFRLGRLIGAKGPGIVLLIPFIDRMVRTDLRTVTLDIPPQDLITRDNVPAKVNAVAYFRVVDPVRSVVEVERFRAATSQISQTTLRSVLGKADLDHLLAERERLNEHLQQIIDEQTDPWGIKVTTVEIKDVGIPGGMQRAMARQAEAERERRAKIINAEGEYQAAERLFDAAEIISGNPAALQLRYLQTLLEVSSNQSSTIVLPVPTDLLRPLLERADGREHERPTRPEHDDEGEPERLQRPRRSPRAARFTDRPPSARTGARLRHRLGGREAPVHPGSPPRLLVGGDGGRVVAEQVGVERGVDPLEVLEREHKHDARCGLVEPQHELVVVLALDGPFDGAGKPGRVGGARRRTLAYRRFRQAQRIRQFGPCAGLRRGSVAGYEDRRAAPGGEVRHVQPQVVQVRAPTVAQVLQLVVPVLAAREEAVDEPYDAGAPRTSLHEPLGGEPGRGVSFERILLLVDEAARRGPRR